MLLTVKDACELHPMALDYSMSEQVENLSDAIATTSATAREFFGKNYVTRGMETLLNQGLRRLGGKSDQAVFELKPGHGRRQDALHDRARTAGARCGPSRRDRAGDRPRRRLRQRQPRGPEWTAGLRR